MLRRRSIFFLPILTETFRHNITPKYSLNTSSQGDHNRNDKPDNSRFQSFFRRFDEVKKGMSFKTPSSSTDADHSSKKASSSKSECIDQYTQELVNSLKATVDSYGGMVKDREALQLEKNLRQILSDHRRVATEMKQNLFVKDYQQDMMDLIPNAIVDSNTKKSLRDLSVVSENITSQFRRIVADFKHPFLVNLGLLRLYSIRKQHEKKMSLLSKSQSLYFPDISSDAINSAKFSRLEGNVDAFMAQVRHFMRHADDVYEDQSTLYISKSDVIVRELNDYKGDHNGDSLSEDVIHPRYVVFLDHVTESVVVGIRGTASISDLITDLHCSTRPFLNSSLHAHAGMAQSAEILLPLIRRALESAWSIKSGAFTHYKIVVTGHSLGAGTGSLLSILLADSYPLRHITAFAFAPPPVVVGDDSVKEPFPSLQSVLNPFPHHALPSDSPSLPPNLTLHSFVLNQDIIPRCSMHEFVNMLSAVRVIDQKVNWTDSDRIRILIRGELQDDELKELDFVLDAERGLRDPRKELDSSEDFRLVIPGHLYWLLPTNGDVRTTSSDGNMLNSFSLVRLLHCEDIFSGFLFTGDDMFRDHLAANYKNALLAISG